MDSEIRTPAPLPETTHPYVVLVSLAFGNNVELVMDEGEVKLPFAGIYTIRIIKEPPRPADQANFITRVSIHFEAFSSACEAERAGKWFALGLLWVSASERVSINFTGWAGDFPFKIIDRTRSGGLFGMSYARAYFNLRPEQLPAVAEHAFRLGSDVPPNVMTSMEFYASARQETSERAQFIGLMTALEALAVQETYGDDIAKLLNELASQLEKSALFQGDDKQALQSLKSSLAGRLRGLRTQSVRQAIVKFIKSHIDNEEIGNFVDEAYGVRSKMLHEGARATQLGPMIYKLEEVLRELYSSILRLPLNRPTSL